MNTIDSIIVCASALLFVAVSTACAHAPAQVAYLSIAGPGHLGVYDIDPSDGQLSLKQTVEVGGDAAPGAMAVSPDGRVLYVSLRRRLEVAAFNIDPDTGKLTHLATSPIDGNAVYLAIDRTGRFIFAAYYGEGKVTVHRLDEQGRVIAGPVQNIATDRHAHAIEVDDANRFVFVPHTGPSAIYQFRFDAATGRLASNDPPFIVAPNTAGPRHFRFHPTLNRAYAVNELDSTVTVYHFDHDRGTLRELQNLPTLPEDFSERNTCAEIYLRPDARFLYASNRGHDSIAVYRMDAQTGELTFIERAATEKTPRSFTLDVTGRFLYAAGQDSGKVAAYHIDPDTGRLTRTATYEVGENPSWVQIVPLR